MRRLKGVFLEGEEIERVILVSEEIEGGLFGGGPKAPSPRSGHASRRD